MTVAKDISEDLGEILAKMQVYMQGEYGRYYILYTHRFKQEDRKGGNILVVPNDPRFDELELVGLIADMIRDYYEQTGIEIKGDKAIKGLELVAKKLYKTGKC